MGSKSKGADPVLPEGFDKIKEIGRRGRQKRVFLTQWVTMQRSVVLKYFKDPHTRKESTAKELVAHPMFSDHPNIIETHLIHNEHGEPFLIEKEIYPLHDKIRLDGADTAVSLVRDISSALIFLQKKTYVHGDIKPDNLGIDGGKFILMDFGVCRRQSELSPGDQTGTLRTCAPEVLAEQESPNHLSDLWALGATLFKLCTGRFPLVMPNEELRLSRLHGRDRDRASLRLRKRTENKSWDKFFWDDRSAWKLIPAPLQDLMRKILCRDPKCRPSANEVVRTCEQSLAPYCFEDSSQWTIPSRGELREIIDMFKILGIDSQNIRSRVSFLTGQRYRERLNTIKNREFENLTKAELDFISNITKALKI